MKQPKLEPCPFCHKQLVISGGCNPRGLCETDGCWMKERSIAVPCDDPHTVGQWNNRKYSTKVTHILRKLRTEWPVGPGNRVVCSTMNDAADIISELASNNARQAECIMGDNDRYDAMREQIKTLHEVINDFQVSENRLRRTDDVERNDS